MIACFESRLEIEYAWIAYLKNKLNVDLLIGEME